MASARLCTKILGLAWLISRSWILWSALTQFNPEFMSTTTLLPVLCPKYDDIAHARPAWNPYEMKINHRNFKDLHFTEEEVRSWRRSTAWLHPDKWRYLPPSLPLSGLKDFSQAVFEYFDTEHDTSVCPFDNKSPQSCFSKSGLDRDHKLFIQYAICQNYNAQLAREHDWVSKRNAVVFERELSLLRQWDARKVLYWLFIPSYVWPPEYLDLAGHKYTMKEHYTVTIDDVAYDVSVSRSLRVPLQEGLSPGQWHLIRLELLAIMCCMCSAAGAPRETKLVHEGIRRRVHEGLVWRVESYRHIFDFEQGWLFWGTLTGTVRRWMAIPWLHIAKEELRWTVRRPMEASSKTFGPVALRARMVWRSGNEAPRVGSRNAWRV